MQCKHIYRAFFIAASEGERMYVVNRLAKSPGFHEGRSFGSLPAACLWLKSQILTGKTTCDKGRIAVISVPETPCRGCTCDGRWIAESYVVDDTGILIAQRFPAPCIAVEERIAA